LFNIFFCSIQMLHYPSYIYRVIIMAHGIY
jgi:hypothetical protein